MIKIDKKKSIFNISLTIDSNSNIEVDFNNFLDLVRLYRSGVFNIKIESTNEVEELMEHVLSCGKLLKEKVNKCTISTIDPDIFYMLRNRLQESMLYIIFDLELG